jgi:DNA-binding transcriptional LysR family regulator
MNYTLNQLAIFHRIARTGSITKAAEELHLTQPAVSIQLRNLQRQFDIPLTEMVHKRLYLTDFGREMLKMAENILNEANAMELRSQSFRGKLTGRLKITVVSTGKYVIPYFVSGFLRRHEAVELQLDVSNKGKVIESLERNEFDFALVSVIPKNLRLKKIELMQNRLYLAGPPDAKVPRTAMDPRMLETLPLIYREEGSATRQAMEKYIEKKRIKVNKKMELATNEAVKQAIMAGLGYSIMPLIGLRNEIMNRQLQIIPARELPIRSVWNLVWLEDKKLSPAASKFMEYIRKEKSDIIKTHFNWIEEF